MFGFFKKKINEKEIKAFASAIQAIEVFIALSEWEKSRKAIQEVLEKEKKSLEEYISEVKDFIKAEQRKKEFLEKENKLKALSNKINILEWEFKQKQKEETFKIRFKAIQKEIENLLWQMKPKEAMMILNWFYEENKDEIVIIKFYREQKALIQKSINKKMWNLESRIKANEKLEALSLLWEEINEKDLKDAEKKEKNFLSFIKDKFKFWYALNKKVEERKLFNEVTLLIEEDSKIKKEIAEKKLAKIHSGLIKELLFEEMIWYDLYWKILWADKISWDAFGIEENKDNYLLFLWDATGHWVKAWFIVSVFNKLFKELKDKNITDVYYEINNKVKQTLESKNFITWALFEINKSWKTINYAWMWHEPILIYNKRSRKVERKVLWGLAAWIRLIKDKTQIKIKNLDLKNGDIMMIFSDWIVEAKWTDGTLYWIDRLEKVFEKIAKYENNVKLIYNYIIEDLELFRWGTKFDDDASILLLKRDEENDLVSRWDEFLENIIKKENLKKEEFKKLEWESKKAINKAIEKRRKEREVQRVIKILEELYYTWEILQLKQEAIRFIKEWYIHKKINFYLKKAMENENKYKIEQKNQKMQNKYNVLEWLYKKWDYDVVIKELEYIISRDWNF